MRVSNQDGTAAPNPTPGGHEPEYHNPVLTRTHEPARETHPMLYMIPLVLVILALIAFWVWQKSHPPVPIVNHAVAAAPTTPAGQ
jgi:hypothetical protein